MSEDFFGNGHVAFWRYLMVFPRIDICRHQNDVYRFHEDEESGSHQQDAQTAQCCQTEKPSALMQPVQDDVPQSV